LKKTVFTAATIGLYGALILLSGYAVKRYMDSSDFRGRQEVREQDNSGFYDSGLNSVKSKIELAEAPEEDSTKGYYPKSPDRGPHRKTVFLTFDDGPSRNNTPKILEILKANDVKATFFIVGRSGEENPDIIREMHQSGMSIVAHSHTHDYSIYRNLNAYMLDLNRCNELIRSITEEEPLPFLRFPGGSGNRIGNSASMRKIRNSVKERNLKYIDWNVSSADAAAETVAMSQIRDNVIKQCNNTNFAVVLMHDAPTKKTTVEALPHIIKYLKEHGYIFRTFKDVTEGEIEEMIKRGIINR
jgi:peptidoglycan-N-acetylglucosamine deacetylase